MLFKSVLASLFAGLALAQHAPVGDVPSGNPITRPLTEIVPAGKPFTITWQPTTPNTVSLILLRGPSENVKPLSTIVVGIPNSGSFVWTPSTDLEPDTTRYGIQLIDDITGQYQYSNQFGISNDGKTTPSSSSKAAPAPSTLSGGYPVSTPTSSKPVSASSKPTSASSKAPVSSKPASSGYYASVPSNSTVVVPTPSVSLSTLLPTVTRGPTVTTSPPAQSTGAAGSIKACLGLVGGFALFAFAA